MVFNGGSRRWTIMLVCVWAIVLAGCAELQTTESKSVKTEDLLSAAGFQMKLANTPEKRANLWKQVQHKLVPQECNGKMVYVYADAAHDRVFVGDPKAYQKFQALAVQNQIAREEAKAAAYNYGAAMNWGLWGPYPWSLSVGGCPRLLLLISVARPEARSQDGAAAKLRRRCR